MEDKRIDAVARTLAASLPRRGVIASAVAVLAGSLRAPLPVAAACKKPGKKCDKNQDCCNGATCKGNTCACKNGRDECGNDCVNLASDEKHCGRCNQRCAAEEICRDGACGCDPACASTEECLSGVCTTPPGGCPPGADSCSGGGTVGCAGGGTCKCSQSTEGATLCGDTSTTGAVCGQCESSADCASFGAGAFCVATGSNFCCGPDAQNVCRLPCAA